LRILSKALGVDVYELQKRVDKEWLVEKRQDDYMGAFR
jgi:hypothetical protein